MRVDAIVAPAGEQLSEGAITWRGDGVEFSMGEERSRRSVWIATRSRFLRLVLFGRLPYKGESVSFWVSNRPRRD